MSQENVENLEVHVEFHSQLGIVTFNSSPVTLLVTDIKN